MAKQAVKSMVGCPAVMVVTAPWTENNAKCQWHHTAHMNMDDMQDVPCSLHLL